MARLPEPGGDIGQWGEVLNDYLNVSHNPDGSLKSSTVTTDIIQDNSVTVAKIATTGTPTNGQALTYDSGSLTWVTAPVAPTTPDASTTTKGIVQLASESEVIAGTDTTKAVTPAGISAAVSAAAQPILFVDALADIPPGTPVDTLVIVRAA